MFFLINAKRPKIVLKTVKMRDNLNSIFHQPLSSAILDIFVNRWPNTFSTQVHITSNAREQRELHLSTRRL